MKHIDATSGMTAVEAAMADRRVAYRLDLLLYDLKRFLRAYPIVQNDVMPDHDIDWLVMPDDDPRKRIMEAIAAMPDFG